MFGLTGSFQHFLAFERTPLSGHHAVAFGLLDTRKESVMDDAKGLWACWQSLPSSFRGEFTLGGWARFAPWVTGTVLC